MGKQRRQRTTFHTSSKNKNSYLNNTEELDKSMDSLNTSPQFIVPDNLFANVNIDVSTIKKSLGNDCQSVKSFKSTKSEVPAKEIQSKKDKLKLRRNLLMQKIDMISQKKEEVKIRNKRKRSSVIGDTNPLHDALPSLESLISTYPKPATNVEKSKNKGIQNAAKRRKEALKNIQLYKNICKNKSFTVNPLREISQHVQAKIEREKFYAKQTEKQ